MTGWSKRTSRRNSPTHTRRRARARTKIPIAMRALPSWGSEPRWDFSVRVDDAGFAMRLQSPGGVRAPARVALEHRHQVLAEQEPGADAIQDAAHREEGPVVQAHGGRGDLAARSREPLVEQGCEEPEAVCVLHR